MYARYSTEWHSITRNIQRTLRTSQPRAQEVSEILEVASQDQQASQAQEEGPKPKGFTFKELREKLEKSKVEKRKLEEEIEELHRKLIDLNAQEPKEEEKPVPEDEDEDFELVSSKDC